MAEVKWIKIATNMFDNRKIKQIRKLPDGDAIISTWVQILCLAGQINDNGMVYFSKDIPYTEEMLATEFDRPINLIRLALTTFEKFEMIEITNDILLVSNWEKYQSADKLERIKEQNRLRQQKFKENQKLLSESNVTVTLPVTEGNATDIDKELDIDIDNKDISKKPKKIKYGEFEKVSLTDDEYSKLIEKLGQTGVDDFITRLDSYKASTGKNYKSDYATILNWSRKEPIKQTQPQPKKYNKFNDNMIKHDDMDFNGIEDKLRDKYTPDISDLEERMKERWGNK